MDDGYRPGHTKGSRHTSNTNRSRQDSRLVDKYRPKQSVDSYRPHQDSSGGKRKYDDEDHHMRPSKRYSGDKNSTGQKRTSSPAKSASSREEGEITDSEAEGADRKMIKGTIPETKRTPYRKRTIPDKLPCEAVPVLQIVRGDVIYARCPNLTKVQNRMGTAVLPRVTPVFDLDDAWHPHIVLENNYRRNGTLKTVYMTSFGEANSLAEKGINQNLFRYFIPRPGKPHEGYDQPSFTVKYAEGSGELDKSGWICCLMNFEISPAGYGEILKYNQPPVRFHKDTVADIEMEVMKYQTQVQEILRPTQSAHTSYSDQYATRRH